MVYYSIRVLQFVAVMMAAPLRMLCAVFAPEYILLYLAIGYSFVYQFRNPLSQHHGSARIGPSEFHIFCGVRGTTDGRLLTVSIVMRIHQLLTFDFGLDIDDEEYIYPARADSRIADTKVRSPLLASECH